MESSQEKKFSFFVAIEECKKKIAPMCDQLVLRTPKQRWRNCTTMNQSTLMNRFVNQFLTATIVLSAPVLLAATSRRTTLRRKLRLRRHNLGAKRRAPLEVRIGLPGFLSSMSGGFGVKGIDFPLNVSFSELLPHINSIPLAASAYVRYNRWEIFGDGTVPRARR